MIEENQNLKAQLDLRFGMENIVGHDHRMLRIYDMIDSVADTKATVLITGESGTGKSLIARAIHRRSGRRDKPFVEVACGALPETLLESELFGHVAGAFTGAVGDKMGKFMQADGGTIFLDEIGTASPGMQVKLLRVLQDFEFEQVGGTKTFTVDTRVILATNEDLGRRGGRGPIPPGPLLPRQRDQHRAAAAARADLRHPAAGRALPASRSARSPASRCDGFSDEAMAALQRYRWPGNVRELQNVIERAVLLGKSDTIGLDDLPASSGRRAARCRWSRSAARPSSRPWKAPSARSSSTCSKSNDWNRHATAEALGINRTTLYKKMKRLGLEPGTTPWRRVRETHQNARIPLRVI